MSEEKEESEFGKGIVTCLAKFSEHLGNRHLAQIANAQHWIEHPEKHAEWEAARKRGDHAAFMLDVELYKIYEGTSYNRLAPGRGMSQMIVLWMNGASDHFYDLDRNRAPAVLVELADLTLAIGHGHVLENVWTKETVDKIFQLWKDSCLAVDAMLGTEPEWGRW